MRPVTPRGFRDVLSQEAAEREAVGRAMAEVMAGWGYGPVETPAVEEFDVLEAGAGRLEGTAFRLFDLDGSLLALRPEMTVPIARLAATRLLEAGPHRLRYLAEVFREHASLRGQSREFMQVGAELIGANGPAADAEVAAVMVETLAASGLEDFMVAMGTVAVLHALLEASAMPEEWRAAVLHAAHDRNLVELDRLAGEAEVPSVVADALRTVPRLRGKADAIEACREQVAACGCGGALDDLAETWRILEATGHAARVRVDFGVMRSFDYYTGLVLEAYAPGLGLPIGGGGRYDRLLGVFGAPSPAAGFALGLERVMVALAEAGAGVDVRGLDALVGGRDAATVLAACSQLRAAGWRVRACVGCAGLALVRDAESLDAQEALLAEDGRLVRLDRAGEPALPLETPIPAPPTLTWAAEGERRGCGPGCDCTCGGAQDATGGDAR